MTPLTKNVKLTPLLKSLLTAGFNVKEGENFNHRNTLSISRIEI